MKKTICISFILLVFLIPSIYVFFKAAPMEQHTFSFSPGAIAGLAYNSMLLALAGALIAAVVGAVCAATVVLYDFPLRRFLEAALCLPLALPSYLVAAIYKDLSHEYFALGIDIENFWGAAIVFGLSLYPYFYILLKISLQSQSRAYVEAGRCLGLGVFDRLVKIVVPLATPAIILGSALVCMEIVSDHATVSLLGVRTFTVGIYTAWFSAHDPILSSRLSALLYVIPLLAIICASVFSRHVSFANPPNRSSYAEKKPLKKAGVALLVFSVAVPLFLGFIFPAFTLVMWVLRQSVVQPVYVDVFNTLSLALLVSVICIVVSAFLAYQRRGPRSRAFAEFASRVIDAQYMVPGIVIGISLLFVTGAVYENTYLAWFTRTFAVIVFACVVKYICFASFSVENGARRISCRYDEIASTLGIRKTRGYFTLQLPLLRRSIIAGAILVFISAAKELTMALVLQPFDYSTLAIRLYSYARMDMLPKGALSALFLVLIVLYPVLSMNRWVGPDKGDPQ